MAPAAKEEVLVGYSKIRGDLHILPANSGFFLNFSEKRLKQPLSLFNLPFGKIPIAAAVIQEQEFNAVPVAPKNNCSGGYFSFSAIHFLSIRYFKTLENIDNNAYYMEQVN